MTSRSDQRQLSDVDISKGLSLPPRRWGVAVRLDGPGVRFAAFLWLRLTGPAGRDVPTFLSPIPSRYLDSVTKLFLIPRYNAPDEWL